MSIFKKVGTITGGMFGGPIGALMGSNYDKSRAQGGFDPYGGMPTAPAYDEAAAKKILAGYKGAAEGGMPSQVGLDAFRNSAMRAGPSPWAVMAGQKTGQEASAARQKGARDVASQAANASTALAMRGGMQTGTRERLARQAGLSRLNLNQDIARQEAGNRLQIGINDEQNRLSQLGLLPGMEMNMADAKRRALLTGVQGEERELDRRTGFNQNLYGQNMSAWAANKQADATMRAAPNKGFLGLW